MDLSLLWYQRAAENFWECLFSALFCHHSCAVLNRYIFHHHLHVFCKPASRLVWNASIDTKSTFCRPPCPPPRWPPCSLPRWPPCPPPCRPPCPPTCRAPWRPPQCIHISIFQNGVANDTKNCVADDTNMRWQKIQKRGGKWYKIWGGRWLNGRWNTTEIDHDLG